MAEEEDTYNFGLAHNPLMPMYDPLANARVHSAPEASIPAIATPGLRPAPIEMPRVAGIPSPPPHQGAEINQLAPNVEQPPGLGTDQLNSLQGVLSMKGLMDLAKPPSLGAVYETGKAAPGAGAGPGRGTSGVSSAHAGPYQDMVNKAATKYNIDPKLLTAQLFQESTFDPKAVSPAGAKGIGQFMPATAKQYGVDVNDPASSIDGAAHYFSDLKKRFNGNDQLALAAYNTGPGNVLKWLQGKGQLEKETLDYVKTITGRPLAPNMQPANVPTAAAAPMAAETANSGGGFKVPTPARAGVGNDQGTPNLGGGITQPQIDPNKIVSGPTAAPTPTEQNQPQQQQPKAPMLGLGDDAHMKKLWQFMLLRSLFPQIQFRNIGYDPWEVHRLGQSGGY